MPDEPSLRDPDEPSADSRPGVRPDVSATGNSAGDREVRGAAPQPPRSAAPQLGRSLPRVLVIVLAATALYLLLERAWGGGDSDAWLFLLGACALGSLAIVGWLLMASVTARRPAPAAGEFVDFGVRGWVGFPLCFFGVLGMIPCLVLAVSPAARGLLDPHSRITASLRDGELEVVFPRPTLAGANPINLTVDEERIPLTYFRRHPEVYRWRDIAEGDRRRLVIDFTVLAREFRLSRPRRIGVNAALDAPQLRDHRNRRIPQQWISLKE